VSTLDIREAGRRPPEGWLGARVLHGWSLATGYPRGLAGWIQHQDIGRQQSLHGRMTVKATGEEQSGTLSNLKKEST